MLKGEKLDLLMKVTDTQNNVLGKVLSFDPSYISRIRKGKRNFPKDIKLVKALAEYFSNNISNAYEKRILSDFILNSDEWPENKAEAQEIIFNWLWTEETEDTNNTDKEIPQNTYISEQSSNNVKFFYGNSGKRDCVELFLTDVISMDNPPELLLYSNEEFDWMYEDDEFAKKWAFLLMSYIKKGGKIKIIHTISRASGEMLIALQKWVPIYMSGRIEPYYYPKILDRIFRKTMFIAKGHSAIVASSIGEHTENAINCLIEDKSAVNAVENEYNNFLSSCKELMKIFNISNKEKFDDVLNSFNESLENTIVSRTTPSFYTMPLAVAKKMNKRLDNSWVLKRQEIGCEGFKNIMSDGKNLTEILNLPDIQKIKENGIEFPMCDLFDKPGLFYETDEFIEHLENVIKCLKSNDNYNVILSSMTPEDEVIHIKEDTGIILVKTKIPTIAFAINEQRMVSAFWNYLYDAIERNNSKEKAIKALEAYIENLKNM